MLESEIRELRLDVRRFGDPARGQYEAKLIQRKFILRADPRNHQLSFDKKMVNTLILVCMVCGCNMYVIPRSMIEMI